MPGTFDHHDAYLSREELIGASAPNTVSTAMARRNRSEVVVEEEILLYHCIQRVDAELFPCGVDPLTNQSFVHRKDWIRDRLEALAGLFGVEIAAFAVMSRGILGVTSCPRGAETGAQPV